MPKTLSFYLANLTLFLIPLYVIRFSFLGLPTTLLEILIGLTTLSWIIENIVQRRPLNEVWQGVKNPLLIWEVGLVLAALWGVLINPDHHAALGIWRAYFFEPLILSLVILDQIRRGLPGRWFVISLLGSGVWLSLIGISQVFFHLPVTTDSLHEVDQGRAAAFFNSANSLALYLGPLLAVSIFLGLKKTPVYQIYWLVTGLILLAVVFTKSTGAKIGLGAIETLVIVNFLWNRVGQRWQNWIWKTAAFIGGISLAALIVLFLNISSFTPKEHFTFPRIYTDTKTIRLCLWEGTKNVLVAHPLTGAGLAGFQAAYAPNRTCDSEILDYPHNIFLNFWTETTILGLIIFVILQTKIWILLRKSSDRLLALGLAAASGYSVLHGLVDVPYFKNDLAVEFWVLFSLAIATAESKLRF